MRVASTVGGLSLVLLLALLLAGCSGQDPEQTVAELTNVGGEASTSGGESGDDSASSTGTTAADAQSPTNEETPSQAAQAAQQVVDQIAGVDAEGAYSRGLQAARSAAKPGGCEPTPSEVLGPYYVPDAPVRTGVDAGYVLSGEVLSAGDCEPIPGAQIELWLANPEGVYDDAHRATMFAGEQGEYQFESNFPGLYENRPPHIHLRVVTPGFRELVTQHYPEAGQTEATFDLVLEPG